MEVPMMTPGARPTRMGNTRRHTVRDARRIVPEHVAVQRDFEQHQGRVQDAIGVEEQRDGNRDGRKPISEGAIDGGSDEGDQNQRGRFG
jgi:hypothetical protein